MNLEEKQAIMKIVFQNKDLIKNKIQKANQERLVFAINNSIIPEHPELSEQADVIFEKLEKRNQDVRSFIETIGICFNDYYRAITNDDFYCLSLTGLSDLVKNVISSIFKEIEQKNNKKLFKANIADLYDLKNYPKLKKEFFSELRRISCMFLDNYKEALENAKDIEYFSDSFLHVAYSLTKEEIMYKIIQKDTALCEKFKKVYKQYQPQDFLTAIEFEILKAENFVEVERVLNFCFKEFIDIKDECLNILAYGEN